jgi:hypothetical protein
VSGLWRREKETVCPARDREGSDRERGGISGRRGRGGGGAVMGGGGVKNQSLKML